MRTKHHYYTPTIEEFEKGFEFEEELDYVWIAEDFDVDNDLEQISLLLNRKKIRVKLLDEDDIYALGFESDDNVYFTKKIDEEKHFALFYEKNIRNGGEVILYLVNEATNQKEELYSGNVKNYFTLKKLLKTHE